MQRLFFAIGGLAVLAGSFFGTLFLLNSMDFQSFDEIRIEHSKVIKIALEKYRATRGAYPWAYADIELGDLRVELVGGGFISQLPTDPYWKSGRINKYRYRSLDGKTYGLLFYMELGPCQTGIGAAATGPWDGRNITTCAF
jgi:hypothetical protein